MSSLSIAAYFPFRRVRILAQSVGAEADLAMIDVPAEDVVLEDGLASSSEAKWIGAVPKRPLLLPWPASDLDVPGGRGGRHQCHRRCPQDHLCSEHLSFLRDIQHVSARHSTAFPARAAAPACRTPRGTARGPPANRGTPDSAPRTASGGRAGGGVPRPPRDSPRARPHRTGRAANRPAPKSL